MNYYFSASDWAGTSYQSSLYYPLSDRQSVLCTRSYYCRSPANLPPPSSSSSSKAAPKIHSAALSDRLFVAVNFSLRSSTIDQCGNERAIRLVKSNRQQQQQQVYTNCYSVPVVASCNCVDLDGGNGGNQKYIFRPILRECLGCRRWGHVESKKPLLCRIAATSI
ncbi:hypothetical protein BDD12DRAFT_812967 [Trichophaea hybrida]|nr:hypothetical protein BDD12DRAFT_812967 [Trichophaea hybrida]